MSRCLILDTSAWVAFLSQADQHHQWAKQAFAEAAPPLLTCEAVVSETCFLLGRQWDKAIEMVGRGLVRLAFRLDEHREQIRGLMRKYADVPMAFADACLVRMAEIENQPVVLTCDSDFRTYRRHGREAIPLLTP